MLRSSLSLIACLLGLICMPAYADEAPIPAPATASLFQVSLPLVTSEGSGTITISTNIVAQAVLTLVNTQRLQAGCPTLSLDPQLTQAAQVQAEDMAEHNFVGHIGSDGSDVGMRVDQTGYLWQSVAENISVGHPTADTTVDAWMDSSAHRANILNCALRDTGVGFVYLRNDQGAVPWSFYWVEVFAKR